MSEYPRVPPIWCWVELPLTEGEETPGFRDQFTVEPVGEHDEQIAHEGDNKAYPDQPFCACKL